MNKQIQDAISRFGEVACIMAYYFNVKQGEGGTFIETNTGIPKRSQGAAIAAGEYLMKGIKKNPRHTEREIGSLPEQGKYTSFKKWAAAVKKIGGRLRSESPVPQIVRGPFGFISEWNGRSGKIEEFFDANPVHRNNPVRQRIAVSLSKSQSRRNPFNDRNLDA